MEIIRYVKSIDLDLYFKGNLNIRTLILRSYGIDTKQNMMSVNAEYPIKIIIPDIDKDYK